MKHPVVLSYMQAISVYSSLGNRIDDLLKKRELFDMRKDISSRECEFLITEEIKECREIRELIKASAEVTEKK